jgi:hypothetical protein
MRRSITIAIIIAAVAITTAWTVSMSGSGSPNETDMRLGGGSAVPMHSVVLW